MAENGKTLPYPEIHLSIPSLTPKGSFKDEMDVFAGLHEIGHAMLYERLLNILCGLNKPRDLEKVLHLHGIYIQPRQYPPIPNLDGTFNDRIIAINSYFENILAFDEFERFSERFAWAHAFRIIRKFDLLGQFGLDDFRYFYIPKLTSYGPSFAKLKNQSRYDKFLAYDPDPWEEYRKDKYHQMIKSREKTRKI